MGIADKADKLPATLSGGQKQRVAVALALALIFGLYPAFRAMRLSPMEAMR